MISKFRSKLKGPSTSRNSGHPSSSGQNGTAAVAVPSAPVIASQNDYYDGECAAAVILTKS